MTGDLLPVLLEGHRRRPSAGVRLHLEDPRPRDIDRRLARLEDGRQYNQCSGYRDYGSPQKHQSHGVLHISGHYLPATPYFQEPAGMLSLPTHDSNTSAI